MEIFSFGERLMFTVKERELSKKELAEKSRISVSTLTKYENDESQPNVDMLTDLAIALDISVMKRFQVLVIRFVKNTDRDF